MVELTSRSPAGFVSQGAPHHRVRTRRAGRMRASRRRAKAARRARLYLTRFRRGRTPGAGPPGGRVGGPLTPTGGRVGALDASSRAPARGAGDFGNTVSGAIGTERAGSNAMPWPFSRA